MESTRCPHCNLVQTQPPDNQCKRCGKDLTTAPETFPVSFPHIEADRALILGLFDAGTLTLKARDAALEALRGPKEWLKWFDRLLLGFGATLILAGVVFFFAFNWNKITPFQKFGLIELGIAACIVGAFFAGLEKLPGKVLLTGAAILVGVFLAVFGQVYQTGADAYELFLGWLLLVLLWILISRFAGLWLLGIVLLNLTLLLYGAQVALPNDIWTASGMFLLLALVDACLLALVEWGGSRGISWIVQPPLRQILLATALTCLTIPTIMLILESAEESLKTTVWAPIAFLAFISGACFYYYKTKVIQALSFCALAFCVVLLTLIGKVLFDASEAAGMYLFFGLVVIGVSGGAAYLLIRVARLMKGGPSHD
jgi:uncharacterized membrane protein